MAVTTTQKRRRERNNQRRREQIGGLSAALSGSRPRSQRSNIDALAAAGEAVMATARWAVLAGGGRATGMSDDGESCDEASPPRPERSQSPERPGPEPFRGKPGAPARALQRPIGASWTHEPEVVVVNESPEPVRGEPGALTSSYPGSLAWVTARVSAARAAARASAAKAAKAASAAPAEAPKVPPPPPPPVATKAESQSRSGLWTRLSTVRGSVGRAVLTARHDRRWWRAGGWADRAAGKAGKLWAGSYKAKRKCAGKSWGRTGGTGKDWAGAAKWDGDDDAAKWDGDDDDGAGNGDAKANSGADWSGGGDGAGDGADDEWAGSYFEWASDEWDENDWDGDGDHDWASDGDKSGDGLDDDKGKCRPKNVKEQGKKKANTAPERRSGRQSQPSHPRGRSRPSRPRRRSSGRPSPQRSLPATRAR